MNQTIVTNLTESFVQDHAHNSRSGRFVHITPSDVKAELELQGFELVGLRTGKAKQADKSGHQTTIARYRHVDMLSKDGGGLHYDIVAKIPHLYGAIELLSGIFRQICTNGLVVGSTFDSFKINHTGDAVSLVSSATGRLLDSRQTIEESINKMASVQLNLEETIALVNEAFRLRAPNLKGSLGEETIRNLLTPARRADTGTDLWTVYNIIQERLTRNSWRYVNTNNEMTATRRLVRSNTAVEIDFNKELFNIAQSFAPKSIVAAA